MGWAGEPVLIIFARGLMTRYLPKLMEKDSRVVPRQQKIATATGDRAQRYRMKLRFFSIFDDRLALPELAPLNWNLC